MKTTLKIACMYCEKDMGEKDGKGVEGTSHSICRECWEKHVPGEPYPADKQKPIRTCAVCGREGEDVNEYPVYNNGRDRTEYQCDDIDACLNRKYSQEGKPWMVKEGAK